MSSDAHTRCKYFVRSCIGQIVAQSSMQENGTNTSGQLQCSMCCRLGPIQPRVNGGTFRKP
eukprot:11638636-Karenia_brevis.AAC.1